MRLVLNSLEDDKAVEIVSIELEGKSSIADYLVIASGTSSRHVGTIAGHVSEKIKQVYGDNCRMEGLRQGDWVVVDAVDVIIHIFRPEVRAFYNLEKLWSVTLPSQVEPANGFGLRAV
ncbi:MAG: ribosome silencing factor [Alphaproteobacteria bacterium]